MCGIAGQVRTDGQPVSRALLDAMGERLQHRGPDDVGVYRHGSAGLVHRRLSILDLSPAGRQPMGTADGEPPLWMVCNGEIYNFAELAKTLRAPHALRSGTDTEVLLHLFAQRGLACLPMLRGMFAFAAWDPDAERLVLARDRLGKKPLYYRVGEHHLSFASRVDALLLDGGAPAVDATALHHYLSFQYVPTPRTAFEGIRKLRPGHVLVYERGVASERAWWSPRYEPKLPSQPEAQWIERFRSLFDEAVRLRLVADVPIGVFLSGGLDSSSVVAAMSRLGHRPVRTFSIGFTDAQVDERAPAQEVARLFDTEHHELVLDPSCLDVLPALAKTYDEPYGDSSAIPTWHLSRFCRETVTVALNGDGGDELFAGYPRYVMPPAQRFMDRMPQPVVRATHRVLARTGRARVASWVQPTAAWYFDRISIFPSAMKRALYTTDFAATVAGSESEHLVDDWFASARATDVVDRMLAVESRSYLPDDLLVKVDRATMAHGLEARSPFLDSELVQFVAALPADVKLRGAEGKYLLKAALRGVLPDHLVHRPKQGFGLPVMRWLREHRRDFVRDTLLSSRSTRRGYFDRRQIEALVDRHERGADATRRVYLLLMLELWHQAYVDG